MSEEYSVGYDAGFQEGRNAAIDEFVTEISQLQAENAALKAELAAAQDDLAALGAATTEKRK